MISFFLPLLGCGIFLAAHKQSWRLANNYDQCQFSHCYFSLPEGVADIWFAALPELRVQIHKKDMACEAQLMYRHPPGSLSALHKWYGQACRAVHSSAEVLLERLKDGDRDALRKYLTAFFWLSPRVAFSPEIYPKAGLRTLLCCLQELRRAADQRKEQFRKCVKKTGHLCKPKGVRLDGLPEQPEKYKRKLVSVEALPDIMGDAFGNLEQRLNELLQQHLKEVSQAT